MKWDSASRLSSPLSAWLQDPGSFMQRLKQHGILHPTVEVIHQHWALPYPEERQILELEPRIYVLVREVVIRSQETIWMFARTLFPRQTLTGKERRFAHLKNRALGSMLFHNPMVTRGEFDFFCIAAGSLLQRKMQQCMTLPTEELWARRSNFYIKNKTILLTEVFLPAIESI